VEYTKIPEDFKEEYRKKLIKKKRFTDARVREDPVLFALYYLDIEIRLHQAWIIKQILDNPHKRTVICLARQLGKSVALAVLALWACWYNKFPATFAKVTAIYIISRDDDASMKLMYKVRQLMEKGDKYMHRFYQKKYIGRVLPNHFTDKLIEPNNTHQITFANGCFTCCLPPTNKILGNSASMVLIDEMARLSEQQMPQGSEAWFKMIVLPCVMETRGYVVGSSSPEGPSGIFYDIIDIEDEIENNTYNKVWFPFTIWDDGTRECEEYKKVVMDEKKDAERKGTLRLWEQEYMASFVTVQSAFFDPEDIENYFDSTIPELYEHKTSECSLGIDYGGKEARTVLTVMRKNEGRVEKIFKWRSPADWDINLLTDPKFEHSIQKLTNRYTIPWIVVDDCPQGNDTNNWIQNNFQGKLIRHNFRSDQMMLKDGLNRNCGFYAFRSAIKQGIARSGIDETMKHEMYIVREEEGSTYVKIKSPKGQLCDTVDSAMMAIQPFVGEIEPSMEIDTDFDEVNQPSKKNYSGRKDYPKLVKDIELDGYVAKLKKDGDTYIPTI